MVYRSVGAWAPSIKHRWSCTIGRYIGMHRTTFLSARTQVLSILSNNLHKQRHVTVAQQSTLQPVATVRIGPLPTECMRSFPQAHTPANTSDTFTKENKKNSENPAQPKYGQGRTGAARKPRNALQLGQQKPSLLQATYRSWVAWRAYFLEENDDKRLGGSAGFNLVGTQNVLLHMDIHLGHQKEQRRTLYWVGRLLNMR